jgi:hypothetical protein
MLVSHGRKQLRGRCHAVFLQRVDARLWERIWCSLQILSLALPLVILPGLCSTGIP